LCCAETSNPLSSTYESSFAFGGDPVRALTHTIPSFLILGAVLSPHALIAQRPDRKAPVDRGSLCVTEGEIATTSTNQLSVESTKMRAYVNRWSSDSIEAHFTYLGGTQEESQLGSGEIRRQFGLKLRAQNACNLIYAMWRIEPESRVVVSIKKNPGQTTSAECGNRGYQNVKPLHAAQIPVPRPGATYTLGVELHGDALSVFVDGQPAWEGNLGPEANGLAGPVGIRSDNVRLAFNLATGVPPGMHPDFRVACKSGPGVSD
jgi:hypothetical protein